MLFKKIRDIKNRLMFDKNKLVKIQFKFYTTICIKEELFSESIYFNKKEISIERTKIWEINITSIFLQIRPKWRFRNWMVGHEKFLKDIESFENKKLIRLYNNQLFVNFFLSIFILYAIDKFFCWIFFKNFQNSLISFNFVPLNFFFFFNGQKIAIQRTTDWKINISLLVFQLKLNWRFRNWMVGHKEFLKNLESFENKNLIEKINKEFYVDIYLAIFILYDIDKFFCYKFFKSLIKV